VDDKHIAFKGTLQQLVEKVERGEMIPKLQASHAPPPQVLDRLSGAKRHSPHVAGD